MIENKIYIEKFRNVLVRLRKDRNKSQEKIAEDAGLHRTFVSRIESGNKYPTINTIISISNALGLSPSEIFKLTEKELENEHSENQITKGES